MGRSRTRSSFPEIVPPSVELDTIKEVFGRETATLSLDAAGEILVAWDPGWDRTYCYKFPVTAKKAAFKRFEIKESFAHPGGQHIIEARLDRRIRLMVHAARGGEEDHLHARSRVLFG